MCDDPLNKLTARLNAFPTPLDSLSLQNDTLDQPKDHLDPHFTLGDWAAEFNATPSWTHEFQQFSNPSFQFQEFEEAFHQAATNTDWALEFKSQAPTIIHGDITETANALVDTLQSFNDEKFSRSKFMALMTRIGDKSVTIKGDKLVQNHAENLAWVDEFEVNPKITARQDYSNSAIHENQEKASTIDWVTEFENRKKPSTIDWLADFENKEKASTIDWVTEFDSQEKPSTSDWVTEFESFQDITAPHSFNQNVFESAWTSANVKLQQTLQVPAQFVTYDFMSNNPFVGMELNSLLDPKNHQNLTESLMALEAGAQSNPSLAEIWTKLGIRQQENENESAAIAAFSNAIKLNPNDFTALLCISASFKNENYSNEAYDALYLWIVNHPEYRKFAPKTDGLISISQKHEIVKRSFINAAACKPGEEFDADIQSALGILFNISGEYDRAVDCFKAAISRRPEDYQLWNKLGYLYVKTRATLANSGNANSAIESYFNALQINPNYVRARYNLAIACIQLGQYYEAAEHLLGALSMQQKDCQYISLKFNLNEDNRKLNNLWSTLRLLIDTYIKKPELLSACDARDLNAFRMEFDFS
jgi:peroxin-5